MDILKEYNCNSWAVAYNITPGDRYNDAAGTQTDTLEMAGQNDPTLTHLYDGTNWSTAANSLVVGQYGRGCGGGGSAAFFQGDYYPGVGGASQNWYVYHSSLGATKYLHLNTYTSEGTASSVWNNTEPTTSVISLGTDTTQSSTYVAYCFADKKGFSKFGSYTGNVNSNGAFIYTGFKPGFILTKLSSTGSEDWKLHDIKRPGFNLTNDFLQPSNNGAELDTSNQMDILSNGFKWRSANTATNSSGNTIVYMAFAAAPLESSNNIPATAR